MSATGGAESSATRVRTGLNRASPSCESVSILRVWAYRVVLTLIRVKSGRPAPAGLVMQSSLSSEPALRVGAPAQIRPQAIFDRFKLRGSSCLLLQPPLPPPTTKTPVSPAARALHRLLASGRGRGGRGRGGCLTVNNPGRQCCQCCPLASAGSEKVA